MARLIAILRSQFTILATLVLVLWVEELVDVVLLGERLDMHGIRPRSLDGLWGVLFSPFLHGGLAHLAANTVPLVILGWLVLSRGTGVFVGVFVSSMLVAGGGAWLLGPSNSVHVGISGVIFGFFGFLVLAGIFEKKLGSLLVTVLVVAAYGGLIFGVLPGQPGISWQSHLFGFLGGAGYARLVADAA
ncbi:MAG: rhomboid family intramembrane serine protease [Myxococcota bacterium]|nr:rhomboid family intramembrane serine protease [Myxococcota bacterium]